MSLAYDTYLDEHIANVQKAETWMYDNLDLGQPEWSGRYSMNHDDSKYSIEEYDPYDQYFYGQNKTWKVCQDFDRAWLHHIHHNPHHWQHWVLIEDDPAPGTGDPFNEAYREQVITVLLHPENYTEDEVRHAMMAAIEFISRKSFKPLEIPKEYVIEMIADWWSFSWKNGNLYEIFDWYAEHRDKQYMHPKTRLLVEDLLLQIKMKLDADRELNGEEIPVTAWPPQIAPFSSVENYILHSDFEQDKDDNDVLEHTGIKGMKWYVRNGPPYPLGDKEKLDGVKKLNDLMNDDWDYGVLDHGKHLLDTDDYDWDKNYRTIPVDILEKEKIGTCWDFVNYQHDKLKNMGIKDNSYLITIQKSEKPDDIVTHTFTTFELGDKKYWLESAAWPKRGVHEINGIEDVAKELNEMYHKPGLGLSIFEYNPEGMDKGLTSNEFFDKASQNLVYDRDPSKYSKTELSNGLSKLEKELKDLKANKNTDPELIELVEMEINETRDELEFMHSDISEDEDDKDLYGVPELKKFPMPDKKHVKSAIRFFNYVDPKYEKELAEAILEKAEEFGLNLGEDINVGDENRFGKYLKKEES